MKEIWEFLVIVFATMAGFLGLVIVISGIVYGFARLVARAIFDEAERRKEKKK